MKRYLPCFIFSILMFFSGALFKNMGVGWQLGSFAFLFAGFTVSFILARREGIRLQKYWARCQEMSRKFSTEMLLHAAHGDFQGSESFRKRGNKVLGLWDKSLKTSAIPKEPELDDI